MNSEIQARYTKESGSCSNLSCGSNISLLEIKKGESILDLGCGRGKETLEAAMLTGPEGKAAGLDLTQAMVDTAAAAAKEAGIANAVFVRGDIEQLPFPDSAFDAVTSNCVINHAKNKETVYREIYRVLKSEGRFVVSDAVTKELLPSEIRNDPEAWAQCFGGAIPEGQYLDSIRAAGFTRIDILKRREYVKSGFDFISLTIMAFKPMKTQEVEG